MSTGPAQTADWEPSDALGERLAFPENYTSTESWQRAITERNKHGGPLNEAERMVWLEGSDEPKQVLFVHPYGPTKGADSVNRRAGISRSLYSVGV